MASASKKRRRRREREKRTEDLLQRARTISLVDIASPEPTAQASPAPRDRVKSHKHSPKDLSQTYELLQRRSTIVETPAANLPKEPSWKRIEFVLPRANGKKRFVFDQHTTTGQDGENGTPSGENGESNGKKLNGEKKSETIEDILFAGKRRKESDSDKSPEQENGSKKKAKLEDKNEEIISETRRRKLSDAFETAHQEDSNPQITNFVEIPKQQSQSDGESPSPAAKTPSPKEKSPLTIKTKPESLDTEDNKDRKGPEKLTSRSNHSLEAVSPGQITGRTVKEAVRDKRGLRPRANSTDGELNLPQGGLCDERMILEAHKWSTDRAYTNPIPPRGLHNLGNTCFLNATLQCLTYLPPLCQTLIAISKNKTNNGQNGKKMPQGQKITSSLCSLFQQAHSLNTNAPKSGGPFAPKKVVNHLPNIGSCGSRNGYKFRLGRQEDAHEFLVHLLDAMNDGELRAAGINQNVSGWRDRLPVSRLDETTFVHRIFGGYFRSQVRCRRCNYRSNTYDPFLDLSLEVSKKSSTSVLKALSEFTRKETLDAANQWKCSGCKKYVCATKQLTVFRPPLTLCIQLKRFAYDNFGFGHKYSKYQHGYGGGGGGSKITKPVEFPGTLHLPLSDNRSCQYTLTGIVIHVGGSSQSGHYTAYVKKPGKNGASQWYHMDDSEVQPVSERTVLKQRDAYLLFYCRTEVKLEFPDPPTRSMSASEATEFGRKRARARANSFSGETETERLRTNTSGVAEKMEGLADLTAKHLSKNEQGSKSAASKPAINQAKKTNPKTENQSSSDDSSSEDEPPPNWKTKTPDKQVVPKASSMGNPKNANRSSTSESGSDSEDDSSINDRKKTPEKQILSKVSPKVTTQNAKESSSSESGSESEGESSSDDEKKTRGKQVEPKISPKRTPQTAKESSSSESGSDSEGDSSSENEKQAKADVPKQTSPATENPAAQTSNRTTVVVNNTDSRGKVKVMLGSRKRKVWESKASAIPLKGSDFQLLGNMKVSQWGDDDDDDGGANDEKPASSATQINGSDAQRKRKNIVAKIEKQNRDRKRKMHLDRWDSHLDQGRQKKIKSAKTTIPHEASSTAPKKNVFQRIQSGVQRMGRGKPKGLFRRKINNKKGRYEV